MRALLGLAVLAACNAVYGLDETEPLVIDPDTDDDGIDDVVDNCPESANPAQADEDGDDIGNTCDNCPHFANTRQADADADSVGDLCDTHPLTFGDCLVLFESFDDPSSFLAHWSVITSGTPPPLVTPMAGKVAIAGEPGGQALVFALGAVGLLDVHGIASVPLSQPGLGFYVLTGARAMSDRYFCGLTSPPDTTYAPSIQIGVVAGNSTSAGGGSLSTRPVGTRAVIRVLPEQNGTGLRVRCQIDYGIGLGLTELSTSLTPVTDGAPGFLFDASSGEIHALAAFRFDPARTGECAPAEIR